MSCKQFTVSIVGGGIGGLTLAIGLLKRGVAIKVYEAAPAFGETGLGLSLGPAAYRTMPLIDPAISQLYDSIVTTHADSPGYEAFRQTWFEIVRAIGPQEGEVFLKIQAPPSGQTTVRRADFLDGLVKLIPKEVVNFNKRLNRVTESTDGVHLHFEDGTSAIADIVVGSDGIRSKTREFVLSDEIQRVQPRYSGMYAYRAVLDMDKMVQAVGDRRARVATKYSGNGAYVVTYPIMRAKKVNIGLFTSSPTWIESNWVRPANRDDMERDFAHMGKHVQEIMKLVQDPSQWAIFDHPNVSTFYKSRVAIMGDAAHASSPHQGAGAGQAIEDAHVLMELIADPAVITVAHAKAAFMAYDAIRRPRSQRVVASSRDTADLLCLRYPGIEDDEEKLKAIWLQRMKWLWDLDVAKQATSAIELAHQHIAAQN